MAWTAGQRGGHWTGCQLCGERREQRCGTAVPAGSNSPSLHLPSLHCHTHTHTQSLAQCLRSRSAFPKPIRWGARLQNATPGLVTTVIKSSTDGYGFQQAELLELNFSFYWHTRASSFTSIKQAVQPLLPWNQTWQRASAKTLNIIFLSLFFDLTLFFFFLHPHSVANTDGLELSSSRKRHQWSWHRYKKFH